MDRAVAAGSLGLSASSAFSAAIFPTASARACATALRAAKASERLDLIVVATVEAWLNNLAAWA